MPGFDLDSSSQLDEILSELLNEASSPSKDSKQRRSKANAALLSDGGQDTGSITTQSGNSRTVISWQTSSSSSSSSAGPTKTAAITRQLTGDWKGDSTGSLKTASAARQKDETRSATITKRENAVNSAWGASLSWKESGGSSSATVVGRPGKTPPPPPPVRRRLTSVDEVIGASAEGKLRWDGEEEGGGGGGGGTMKDQTLSRNCSSDTEETRSWLDDQIWKLQAKKTSGKSYQQHTRLEKQLIADLKNRLGLGGGGGTVTQSDLEDAGGLGELTDSNRKKKPSPPQPPQRNKDSGTHMINITFDTSKTTEPSPRTAAAAAAAAATGAANDVFSLSQSDTEIKSLLLTADPKQHRTSTTAGRTPNETTSVRLFRTVSDNEVVVPKVMSARGEEERSSMVRRDPVVRSSSLGDASSKPTYKAKASFYVSGIERPAFSTHQTKYTFSVNPLLSEEDGADQQNSSRLPPVPPSRCSAPTSPVAPKRGDSSREAILKSQRRIVCSPNIDELENSLRLIVEQQPQTNSSAPEKDAVDRRKVTSPVRDIDDEVIILKPIGPGIQTLEPDSTGTLKRPMTPLIPLSVTNNTDETLRKIRDSADNINSLGRPNQQSQVNVQYSSETIKEVKKQGTAPNYVTQPLGIGDHRMITTQQQPRQQQQTLPQQQSLQQQQQQQQWQQQLQQFYSSQQPSLQHPLVQQPLLMSLQPQPAVQSPQQQTLPLHQQQQEQIWQQQTWQQQQSWPKQQFATQQPQLQQHSNMPPSMPFNQNTGSMQVTSEVTQQRILQQQPNLVQHGSQQPLLSGMPTSQQLVGGQQQGSNLYNKQQYQEAFANQGGQRIDVQSGVHQFGPQMLNAQQMGGQMAASSSLQNTQTTGQQNPFYGQNVEAQQFNQANNFQLMERQLTNVQPQMIGGQTVQQSYAQQMGVYQNTPKFTADHGGVQQERSKYVTIEHTTSTLPRNGTLPPNGLQPHVTAVQNTVDIPLQYQLSNIQNHGQLQQQQLQFQQEQQQQQQQIQQLQNQQLQKQVYNRVFQSSSAEQMQNERQRIGSSMTLDNRTKSPIQLGSPTSLGSWPSDHGYADTLGSQTLQMKRSGGTNTQFVNYETLMRSKSPSLMRAASPASIYNVQFRNGSLTSLTDGIEFANTMPRFVRDTSKYWHKPNISREEAINMLRDKPPGTFVVRNSTTFQGGFGLALKVAQLPPNVQAKGDDLQANLVRHFLIESNSKGVRLKGCSNEPVFGSLAALIYQHSITPLALPCKLLLPTADSFDETDKSDVNTLHSSVCNTLYVESINTESLTGPEALSRSIAFVFGSESFAPKATPVQLKVSHEGITLTDNKHRLFFRRHYPLNTVSFCGMDGNDRRLPLNGEENVAVSGKIFGFVARKSGGNGENACHLFLNPENNESASSIVDLVTKVMMGQGQFMKT